MAGQVMRLALGMDCMLYLKDCPYAYYFHCLAHPLQLALVAAAKHVIPAYQFFKELALVTNVVTTYHEILEQLRISDTSNIANQIVNQVIETGSGLDERGTL